MTNFSYKSDLNGGPLMVRESRLIADLLLRKVTSEEWKYLVQDENILQKPSIATAQRNSIAIKSRLILLAPEFLLALRDGGDELATQVSFYAVLERNLLMLEFMETVVYDAYAAHAYKIESYQWLDFLEDCSHKDLAISKWTDSTRKKMGQIVFRILYEVGYIESVRNAIFQNVVLQHEFLRLINQCGKERIKNAMQVSLKINK